MKTKEITKDLEKAFSIFMKSKRLWKCELCDKKYKSSVRCYKHLIKKHNHNDLSSVVPMRAIII